MDFYLNGDSRLVIRVSCEGLGLLGWDGGVSLDEGGHHTSGGLDAHGQGSDIQEQQVRHGLVLFAGQNGSLQKKHFVNKGSA